MTASHWKTALTRDRAFWQRGLGSMAVKATSVLLALVLSIVLARELGPAGYGTYAYVFALVLLLAIPAVFGLPSLVVRETARALASSRWDAVDGVWRWALAAAGVLSASVVLIAALSAWLFSEHFSSMQLATFAWGLLLVPLIALVRLGGGALRGLNMVVWGQVPDMILRYGVLMILLLLVVWLGSSFELTPARAMALHAFAGIFALAVAGFTLLRARAKASEEPTVPEFQHSKWLNSLVPLGFSMSVLVINEQAGIILLGFFADSAEVGIYRAAVQAAMLVSFGLTAMNMAVAPAIARLHQTGKREELQRMVTLCTRVIFAMALPVALVFGIWGADLLALAFGETFAAGHLALVILIAGQLVNTSTGTVGLLLDMTGHERETLRGFAVGAGANVALGLLLIPLFGMAGAAAAAAASRVAWNVVLRASVRRHLAIEPLAFGNRPVEQSP